MIVTLTLAPGEAVTDVADCSRQLAADLGVCHDFVDVVVTHDDRHYADHLNQLSPSVAEAWLAHRRT